MASNEETVLAFESLGLSQQKAKETLKNTAVTKNLLSILNEVKLTFTVVLLGSQLTINFPISQINNEVPGEAIGILLYHLGTKIKPQIHHQLPILVKYIMSRKLDNTLRVDKAIEFALSHINLIDTNELEKYCGVGVVVTPEQVETCVEKHLIPFKGELMEKRYKFNAGPLMQKVREELPWAGKGSVLGLNLWPIKIWVFSIDGKAVKNEIDVQILDILGPKTEADLAPASKTDKKAAKPSKTDAKAKGKPKESNEIVKGMLCTIHFISLNWCSDELTIFLRK